jgi:hypothetical protein
MYRYRTREIAIRAKALGLQRRDFDGPQLGLLVFEQTTAVPVQSRVRFTDRAKNIQKMITAINLNRVQSWDDRLRAGDHIGRLALDVPSFRRY